METKPKIDFEWLESMGDPISRCEFAIELGSETNLSAACSAFEVRPSYLTLTFVAMTGVTYADMSGMVIKIKAVDSRTNTDVVTLKYRLTKLKCVLTSGVADTFGLRPNLMTFEQRYTYEFVGIESK
jgi:hypothetical protein